MNIAAIICEFNPFHKGHKYLIDSVRRDLNPDAVVCIMSGNYVQRGMPAVINKWVRAESALNAGVDLVVQMPVNVSLSSAKYFAKGGVDIAKGLNADFLCFGSVSGDISSLKALAENGIEGIENGNDILASEYLRNLDDNLNPWTISIDKQYKSASEIRESKGLSLFFENSLFQLLKFKIVSEDESLFKLAPESRNGLENRLKEAVLHADSFDSLILEIKSKGYTYTSISRFLMQILLGIKSSEVETPYAHLLGFNDIGREVLKNSNIKIYPGIKPEDCIYNNNLALDVKADDIYSVIMDLDIYKNSDYVCKPIKSNI